MPLLTLAGCEEKEINQVLVDNIWQEVVKVATLPENTPKPVIEFIHDNDTLKENAHGRYYWGSRKAEIYLGQISQTVWSNRDRYHKYGAAYGVDISYREGEALIYNTVAHEMFHYALHVRGEIESQHRIMKDRQYLSRVIDIISDHFKLPREGWAKHLSLSFLDYGISKDEEWEKENKSSYNLQPNNQIHADTDYKNSTDCW